MIAFHHVLKVSIENVVWIFFITSTILCTIIGAYACSIRGSSPPSLSPQRFSLAAVIFIFHIKIQISWSPPPLSLNREHVINGSEKKELKLKLQRISILLRIFMIWHFPHFPIIFLYFFIACQDYLNETAPPPTTHTHTFYMPVIISLRICQQKETKLCLVDVTPLPSNEGWKQICNHMIHIEYCCPFHQKKKS